MGSSQWTHRASKNLIGTDLLTASAVRFLSLPLVTSVVRGIGVKRLLRALRATQSVYRKEQVVICEAAIRSR